MSGFEFPPPQKAQQAAGGEVEYPDAPVGGRFIFPPPRVTDTSDAEETLRLFGHQLSAWGDLTQWAAETSRNQGQVLADYGEALERKVEPWAVPTIAPLSATINRRADPTFQLSDFMVPLVRGTSDNAGHNHQHTTTSAAYRLNRGMATKNRLYCAFITPAINRAYEKLHFMVSEVTSPCRMDVGIYVVTEDRVLARQVAALDVGVGLSLGETLVTVDFPRWVATQGSYVAITWLQHGTGNTRSILGLDDTPRPLTNLVFPRKISAIHTSTSVPSLPVSIDGTTALDFEGYWFTPYAELSEDIGIELRSFTEAWPKLGGPIGRPWVPLTEYGIGSDGGHTAAFGSGLRVSMYDTPLSTDRVRVRSSIYKDSSPDPGRRSTLIVRGTNNLTSGLGLSAISKTRYELIQWAGRAVDSDVDWNDRTVLATIPRAPRQGDRLEIDFLDGVATVRINDTPVVDGLPVSGMVGPAYRYLGIQNRRQAFILADYSPWFGPWSARDLPAEAGDDEDNNAD
ncbi:hypothetical protein M3B38_01685 [Dietzia cinnamea]|uniref:hypothetical protein n=1 Tax=Dietzia cinnamea TaxID=321318 RepID=UPI0021A87EB2|nr:hypothetical protein [Dietzia cinnamea]MCT1710701.1 hypothetical protein [Dietzia cinnamea]